MVGVEVRWPGAALFLAALLSCTATGSTEADPEGFRKLEFRQVVQSAALAEKVAATTTVNDERHVLMVMISFPSHWIERSEKLWDWFYHCRRSWQEIQTQD